MGKYNKGLLGPFSGNVGPIVGSSWKGLAYMKSLPIKKKRTSTADQLIQQLKFALIVHFLQTMTSLLELTFKAYAVGMSEFNAAFSYNFRNAITGISPDFAVNYAEALVSRGDLPNATAPTATAAGGGIINFAWTDNSGTGSALATDNAVVVAYCEAQGIAIFANDTATRSSGGVKLNVADLVGQTVQTWVAFISANGTLAANSIFTGQLTVS